MHLARLLRVPPAGPPAWREAMAACEYFVGARCGLHSGSHNANGRVSCTEWTRPLPAGQAAPPAWRHTCKLAGIF
jgi:hypothetical protein